MIQYIELEDGWKIPKQSAKEEDRLHALYDLDILDTSAEESFDRITELVSTFLKAPISLVSLVDKDRQWFKSCYGIDAEQTSRNQSFCAHVIEEPHEILYVPDAQEDDRFRANTLVTEEPHIRLYIGAPLITKSGYSIGSLCAIDREPRYDITQEQKLLMRTMADIVVDQLEMRIATKKIEDANKRKTMFFTGLSHEIRTPMNGIIGSANLMKQSPLDDKQSKYLDLIIGSGNMLLEIINEILDYAKIEGKRLKIYKTPIEIKRTIQNQVELLRSIADEKDIQYNLEFNDSDLPNFIKTDETRIRQILSNLIGNAIKFTPAGGNINVRVDTKDLSGNTHILFEIEDTGVGIADDKINNIFLAFEQVLEHRKDSTGSGTGLGLPISKYLIELLKGEIGVTSQLDKGSTFWFSIPLEECSDDEIQALEQEEKKHKASQDKKVDAHVLLVEDTITNQYVITSMLEHIGCSVDVAINGKDALEKVLNNTYDHIFMDCLMPVMDGYEATRKIRALDINQPKISAITANAFEEDRQKCLESGMDDIITKPVDPAKLREAFDID